MKNVILKSIVFIVMSSQAFGLSQKLNGPLSIMECTFAEHGVEAYVARGYLILTELDSHSNIDLGLESPVQTIHQDVKAIVRAIRPSGGRNRMIIAQILVNGADVETKAMTINEQRIELSTDVDNRRFSLLCIQWKEKEKTNNQTSERE